MTVVKRRDSCIKTKFYEHEGAAIPNLGRDLPKRISVFHIGNFLFLRILLSGIIRRTTPTMCIRTNRRKMSLI